MVNLLACLQPVCFLTCWTVLHFYVAMFSYLSNYFRTPLHPPSYWIIVVYNKKCYLIQWHLAAWLFRQKQSTEMAIFRYSLSNFKVISLINIQGKCDWLAIMERPVISAVQARLTCLQLTIIGQSRMDFCFITEEQCSTLRHTTQFVPDLTAWNSICAYCSCLAHTVHLMYICSCAETLAGKLASL